MKNALLSGVAATALALSFAAPARAQAPAIQNWAGFYVGLNAGAAWGRSGANTSVACSDPFSPPAYLCFAGGDPANAAAVGASGTGTMTSTGFTGGVQAGYNWQTNNLVYGLETDFGAFNLRGSRQGSAAYPVGGPGAPTPANAYTVGSSFDTDWLFTFRGRLGWALPSNLMIFATGGLALTNITVGNSFSDDVAPTSASESARVSKRMTGWVLGAGLEWALNNRWTVKAEYLRIDFGTLAVSGTITNDGGYSQGISTTADLTGHIARLGVNYRF